MRHDKKIDAIFLINTRTRLLLNTKSNKKFYWYSLRLLYTVHVLVRIIINKSIKQRCLRNAVEHKATVQKQENSR